MKKTTKITLGTLGAFVAVAAPIITVVSCGQTNKTQLSVPTEKKENITQIPDRAKNITLDKSPKNLSFAEMEQILKPAIIDGEDMTITQKDKGTVEIDGKYAKELFKALTSKHKKPFIPGDEFDKGMKSTYLNKLPNAKNAFAQESERDKKIDAIGAKVAKGQLNQIDAVKEINKIVLNYIIANTFNIITVIFTL